MALGPTCTDAIAAVKVAIIEAEQLAGGVSRLEQITDAIVTERRT